MAQPVGPSSWDLPDPSRADRSGVVGFGADLAPETLVDAYRRGIFPWPHEGLPLPWFSPDPRGVIPVEAVHVSRSLRRRMRRAGWTSTVDAAFDEVIHACAARPDREDSWITPDMRDAYGRLHALGWAHSLEIWEDDELVGGIYGVQLGAVFTGESMFHRVTDSSKAALVDLAARFRDAGGTLVDVQLTTPHLCSLGAADIPRQRFLELLAGHRDDTVRLSTGRLPVRRLA